jgi:hypothetical protein
MTARVFFRTGLLIIDSDEHVASRLVLRLFGSLDCINDNTKCLVARDFPTSSSITHFGEHHVYVSSTLARYSPVETLLLMCQSVAAVAQISALTQRSR